MANLFTNLIRNLAVANINMGFVPKEFYIMDVGGSNLLNPGQTVDNRWKIVKSLEHGSFGSIFYVVKDLKRLPRIFAMKVESKGSLGQDQLSGKHLQLETKILQKLKANGSKSSLNVEAYGENDAISFLVTEIFGPNLKLIRDTLPRKMFNLRTTLHIAQQSIKAIEELHIAGFLHRDIKIRNIVIGKTSPERLSLINFELARKFLDDRGVIIPPRSKVEFCGTIRYASVDALNGKEMGPVDDLWAWFYSVIELTSGRIPLPDKEAPQGRARLLTWTAVEKQKLLNNSKVLLACCSKRYRRIYEHLSVLRYEDKPDYCACMKSINSIFIKRGIDQNSPLDWQLTESEFDKVSKSDSERSIRND